MSTVSGPAGPSQASAPLRPLAILGGTFDPVHLGHLRCAWEAAETLDAEVRLMPCNSPPHRAQPVADPQQRAAILRAALAGQGRLALDLRELRRSGPSYSIDTLIDLRNSIGPVRPLIMLLGTDAFAGLPGWHRWRELFEYAHIGVLTRPGHHPALPAALQSELDHRGRDTVQDLRTAANGHVSKITVTALEISSSAIRDLLIQRRQPRYLLPSGVLAEQGLLAPYLPAAQ